MKEISEIAQGNYFEVADGVWGMKDIFVNVYFVSTADGWVLIDTGLKSGYEKIINVAGQLFGDNVVPEGIVLTHGHFDHVGSLEKFVREWKVPVYAHHLEQPYLNGKSAYPPADSTVGGGLMSALADFYPIEPLNMSGEVESLPFSMEIPVLPEWRYIHTPGHAPGHISLWREKDKVLIVGDAFVTTKQESALAALSQIMVLSGPPKYFTCDWQLAKKSVETLALLNPEVVATGHGKPMFGEQMRQDLRQLAFDFDAKAVPSQGRYVSEPAITNQYGVVFLPPKNSRMAERIAIAAGILILAGLGFVIGAHLSKSNVAIFKS
ncbi:MBL fold metallo-hydrolase [Dyadobacter sp. CY345]|uniref:MBL fold metallo-hydrolase n=1 Tax=Dyadobacter sp. CY345 TaxID=2909335 RepID=UPI001F33FD0D|nr:MBL fold metallo-hydrolase [Dyadobacter sp. CY345]MCF2446687.1 MBL fold metallo-hydrolase [Dyadobacter sp. CY345]